MPTPDPFDDLAADLDRFGELAQDPKFLAGGPVEASASERAEKYARIARGNDALAKAGEISHGTGKPAFHAKRRRNLILLVAGGLAAGIILLALLVR